MKRVLVSSVFVLGIAISFASAQNAVERQVIVFARNLGLWSPPMEVTVDAREASVIKDGAHHLFSVNGPTAFVFVQTTSIFDHVTACGYLATVGDSGSPYYLVVTRPALQGVLKLEKVDPSKAQEWLAKEQQ